MGEQLFATYTALVAMVLYTSRRSRIRTNESTLSCRFSFRYVAHVAYFIGFSAFHHFPAGPRISRNVTSSLQLDRTILLSYFSSRPSYWLEHMPSRFIDCMCHCYLIVPRMALRSRQVQFQGRREVYQN